MHGPMNVKNAEDNLTEKKIKMLPSYNRGCWHKI